MAQLFSPRADITLRTALAAAIISVVALPLAAWAFARTPAATGQYRAPRQPVPFAHSLHVNGLKIDCRYCHAGAERAAMAGLPPTAACVPCHRDATVSSNLFTAVRQSLSSGKSIPWQRVTNVPDFVFFNHAVHVRNGVSCQACHGPVESMAVVYQAAPLTMEWCVQCHRAPERYAPGAARVEGLLSCTTCHR